ncbi:MAG: hypothetical protein Q9194_002856 [Teloschistes cf. exilis]
MFDELVVVSPLPVTFIQEGQQLIDFAVVAGHEFKIFLLGQTVGELAAIKAKIADKFGETGMLRDGGEIIVVDLE